MAVRTATKISLTNPYGENEGVEVYQWTGLTNATSDSGSPVALAAFTDRSVQVTGTFGTGGSVRIEGTIDGTNYSTLTDPQGNALDITTAKIETITEAVVSIRPRVTAGDGTTSLVVTMMFKK